MQCSAALTSFSEHADEDQAASVATEHVITTSVAIPGRTHQGMLIPCWCQWKLPGPGKAIEMPRRELIFLAGQQVQSPLKNGANCTV